MSNIAQPSYGGTHLRRAGTKVKLWPNGELSIYREKKMNRPGPVAIPDDVGDSLLHCCLRAYGVSGGLRAWLSLGLSPHPNFDKPKKERSRYGLRGISGKGKRRVRNACYMMTRENGKHRLTFATVTVPEMAIGNMNRIHKNWHKVIEFYRREIRRVLVRGGLSGELVSVTEVQEKRYEKTGLPVLHAHFVFVGSRRGGGWVLTPSRHDYIWRKALLSVCPCGRIDVSASCQLKSVNKSAEMYLGKYMSKGIQSAARIANSIWSDWIPKQWWSCSRTLVRRMEQNLRIFDHGCNWLLDKGNEQESDMFVFWRHVELERGDGTKYYVASYGRLTPKANGLVRKVLNLRGKRVVNEGYERMSRNVKYA